MMSRGEMPILTGFVEEPNLWKRFEPPRGDERRLINSFFLNAAVSAARGCRTLQIE